MVDSMLLIIHRIGKVCIFGSEVVSGCGLQGFMYFSHRRGGLEGMIV